VSLLQDRRVLVLAGAGCSTESGIPDYRGPDSADRPRRPIQFGDFVRSEEARARYWARSSLGWPRVAAARPNPAHLALAGLERMGRAAGIVTQNVDGLHQAAGSRRVVELHGALSHVRCLECGDRTGREEMQARLRDHNPAWAWSVGSDGEADAPSAPDGDAELDGSPGAAFRVPGCARCGGVLKPDVVFFGENVPRETVDDAWRLFDEAEALLVVGSSLTVYSGRRFLYRAVERSLPVAVMNLGPTRADDTAAVKVEGRLGTLLPRLLSALLPAE
jgi:NAD+-dependent protein deacetylase sirtuin 4